VQVVGELADAGERLDQAVVELERVRSGEADAFDPGTRATWWMSVARSTRAPSAIGPSRR